MVNQRSFFAGHPSYFRQEIMPVLRIFEGKRKLILQKILKIIFLIALLIIAVVILLTFQLISQIAAFILLPVVVVVFAIVYRQLTKQYKMQFKLQVITAIVNFFDSTLQYDPHGRVSKSQFVQSGLFNTSPDRYRGEDRVFGTLGKTRIEFSEVHAEYQSQSTDSDGATHTSWHTIFKGLFFVADFNKQIKGTTVVLPDVAERLFGGVGKLFQNIQKIGRHPELITLEDPVFEKYFVVYVDDQNEARYILTPNLMERIVSFRQRTGQKLRLSFSGENVYVAIPSDHDMFEARVFRTLWSKTLIKSYVDDMAMAIGVVEELNLNRRVWTKP